MTHTTIEKIELNIENILNTTRTTVNPQILQVLTQQKDFILTCYKDHALSTTRIATFLQESYKTKFTKNKNNNIPLITLVHIKNFLVENGIKIRPTKKRKASKK